PASAPLTALRAMSGPRLASTLSAYVQVGGRVWLAGGGAANASLVNFNSLSPGNDRGQTTVYSSLEQFHELGPSRIMFDAAHWQSTIGVTTGIMPVVRYENTVKVPHPGGPVDTTYIVAPAWSHGDHFRPGSLLDSPDYRKLPERL